MIHDLSYPEGQPFNELIPNDLTTVQYEDSDYVVSLIMAVRISKVRIKNAFCIMPIHSLDCHLCGFHWHG